MGFVSSEYDQSLFLFNTYTFVMFVLVYVDDIVITSSVPGIINKLIQELQFDFAIKDLGLLHFFLGVEATWHGDMLYLSQ
jgi:type III secretory pathway component EscS